MNRSYLALVMAFAIAPLACAPVAKKEVTPAAADDSLVCVETRSLEVLTKASLHYFKVAKRTAFSTFDHDLEFVTEERLSEFNRYEDAQKHSFAIKSACQPVKELLEILKTTQRELLLNTDKAKAVIVKFSFKDTSKTALVKFEFSKKINEETKTVESLQLKISIFGFEDEVDETILNFIKACALENTFWQNSKPFIIGGTLIGSALVAGLAIKTTRDNRALIKDVRPIFEGLATELARQLNLYHESHPESYARHTHDKYTEPWFSEPTRVEPWFEYNETTAHEGLWEHVGLTFASTRLSESTHRKNAGVIATAWLPGSFATLCATAATWDQQTAADQERILVVPYSVLTKDTEHYQELKAEYKTYKTTLTASIATLKDDAKAAAEQALPHQLKQKKLELLMSEQLNTGNWMLVVVNDTDAAIDTDADSPVKTFLADTKTYIVITTAKLADATTTKVEATCRIGKKEFKVTADREDGATPQETLARLTVDALFSSVTNAALYTETVSDATKPAKKITVNKANAATALSRRDKKTPFDVPSMTAHVSLPIALAFARNLDALAHKKSTLSGMELFVTSSNVLSEKLTQFLSRTVTVNKKQTPRVIIIPSPLMDLCKSTEFTAAVNAAHATMIVVNTGETDEYEEITVSKSGKTITISKTTVNFATKAQTALAGIERAIMVPVDLATLCYRKSCSDTKFLSLKDATPEQQAIGALVKIYA